MNIKKGSKSTVILESSQAEAKIETLFYNGTITAKIILPAKTIEIAKPGDYEYSHIGYTGYEIPAGKYKGIVNLCKLVLEGVRVVIVFADAEIDKDVLNELVNVDVLITPFFPSNRLKEHIADIDPKNLLILKDFESSTEFNIEDIKKTLGVSTIEEASSFKFKSADFSSSEEYTLTTNILR